MGFKASMIIIQHPSRSVSDEELLKMLGFTNVSYSGDTTFEECMYPGDKSINFGQYNDCLVISDDYQLTTFLELSTNPQSLSDYEKVLTEFFPGTEILTVACHSGVNYHLYSLVKDGQKLRFKKVVHGEPVIGYGDIIEEEKSIYAYSKTVDGQLLFRSPYNDDEVYDNTEDQLMEEFAFGVAKRHLGVKISTSEDDELMFETTFKKYAVTKAAEKKKEVQTPPVTATPTKGSWLSRLFKK
jgi:hypothetical protein